MNSISFYKILEPKLYKKKEKERKKLSKTKCKISWKYTGKEGKRADQN
jgi:hypothetical protein